MIAAPSSWPARFPWQAADLVRIPIVRGGHGAQALQAPDGSRWLFKPRPDAEFLASLDEALARLQAHVGLVATPTYIATRGGVRGSIQLMFDAYPGFGSQGFRPWNLHPHYLNGVLRHHAFDWSVANHDGKAAQFLRVYRGPHTGQLAGIDKSQAFRWLGQDELAWDFRPNWDEPVYNALWYAFAKGHPRVHIDPPGEGPLWEQVRAMQAVDDDDLRELVTPYAEEAHAEGRLAVREDFPDLQTPRFRGNDVDAFLAAVVTRKHALADDFADLHRRAAASRQDARLV